MSANHTDTAKNVADPAERSRSDFRVRLKAWWNGDVLPADKAAKTDQGPPKPERREEDDWPAERVSVVQMIWGDGFNFPGAGEFAAKLAAALGVEKNSTVLDIGCGLGGAVRMTAQNHSCVVHGFEPQSQLAIAGNEISREQNMLKQAPIAPLTFAKPGWRPKTYDAALARNVISHAPSKTGFLTEIATALRSGGRLVVVDWCIRNYDNQSPAFETYVRGEPTVPDLDTAVQLSFMVENAGFNVRSSDDLTEAFKPLVIDGWRKISTLLAKGQVAPNEAKVMVREAELWARRIAAMQAGDLGLVRIKALKRA